MLGQENVEDLQITQTIKKIDIVHIQNPNIQTVKQGNHNKNINYKKGKYL